MSKKSRGLLLVFCILFCSALAMAQFTAPASQVELDGSPGPSYTVPPAPPTPANPLNTCTYLVGGVVMANQPCDYWNSINGLGLDPTFPFTATKPYNHYGVNTFVSGGAGTESFTGGGSKDPNDIPQWKWSSGPTPDKDTLTNGYAAAYTGPTDGHTVLLFGMDRFSTSGDANIGAWFFQQGVGPVSGGTFSGSHVNGDVFLISAFTNGGGTSTITVFLWDATGLPNKVGPANGCTASNYPTPTTLPACAATNLLEVYSASANSVCGNNPTCAITNASNVNVTWNYQAKLNSGTGPSTVPTGAFFTGGVDLTFIFQTLLGLPVPCLSSFLYDTRSSQSPSSVLKDFIGGNFQLCSISANASCTSTPTYTIGAAPNYTPTIHYTINGSVKNESSGNLFGLHVATTVVPANAANVVITQPVTPSGGLAFSNTAPFTVNFDYPNLGSISVSGNACGAAFDGGPCTVVNKPDGTPATWTATAGSSTTCHLSPTTSMTLDKSCVINLVPGSNGVVLQLADNIKVCNTDANDPILNINLTNTVQNVTGSPFTITPTGGLSLAPNTCKTYTPTYTPTNCVNSVLNGANADPGRCLFTDTVDFAGPLPTDEFGTPVNPLPPAVDASCHVCLAGQCTPSGTP